MNSTLPTNSSGDSSQDATPTLFLEVTCPGADATDAAPQPRHPVWLCTPGQVVARIVASAEPNTPHAIFIPMPTLKLGRNVAWDRSETSLIATKLGHIVVRNDALSIEESLELNADIDAAMPIDFPGDVFVYKNILDGAKLNAKGNVIVNGAIEAAEVSLTGDLTVHHGICSKEKGYVTAKGSIHARFISNVHITADGNLHIQNEVANSRIICGGQFNAKDASILSSHITAISGISCDSAGSTAGFRTILELGLNPVELAHTQKVVIELIRQREKTHDIRSKVEPLLKNQKNLTAGQKEKATELLYLADEADVQATQAANSLQSTRCRIDTAFLADIRVNSMLHSGVTIRCLGFEAMTAISLPGPIRLTLKISRNDAQFIVTDSHNKQVAALAANATDACAVTRQLQLIKF